MRTGTPPTSCGNNQSIPSDGSYYAYIPKDNAALLEKCLRENFKTSAFELLVKIVYSSANDGKIQSGATQETLPISPLVQTLLTPKNLPTMLRAFTNKTPSMNDIEALTSELNKNAIKGSTNFQTDDVLTLMAALNLNNNDFYQNLPASSKGIIEKNLLNGGFIGIDIVSQMASVYLDEVMKGVSDGTINVAEAIKAIPLDRIKGDDIFAKIDTLKQQVQDTINDFKKIFELGKGGNFSGYLDIAKLIVGKVNPNTYIALCDFNIKDPLSSVNIMSQDVNGKTYYPLKNAMNVSTGTTSTANNLNQSSPLPCNQGKMRYYDFMGDTIKPVAAVDGQQVKLFKEIMGIDRGIDKSLTGEDYAQIDLSSHSCKVINKEKISLVKENDQKLFLVTGLTQGKNYVIMGHVIDHSTSRVNVKGDEKYKFEVVNGMAVRLNDEQNRFSLYQSLNLNNIVEFYSSPKVRLTAGVGLKEEIMAQQNLKGEFLLNADVSLKAFSQLNFKEENHSLVIKVGSEVIPLPLMTKDDVDKIKDSKIWESRKIVPLVNADGSILYTYTDKKFDIESYLQGASLGKAGGYVSTGMKADIKSIGLGVGATYTKAFKMGDLVSNPGFMGQLSYKKDFDTKAGVTNMTLQGNLGYNPQTEFNKFYFGASALFSWKTKPQSKKMLKTF